MLTATSSEPRRGNRVWTGRPQRAPRWDEVTPTLRRARAEWYAGNPWKPTWKAHTDALQGAALAMKEAERTAGAHQRALETARAITGGKPINVTEYAA